MDSARVPEWKRDRGLGAQGIGKVTEGVVGFLHSAGLKEKNLQAFQRSPSTLSGSVLLTASPCHSLSRVTPWTAGPRLDQ